MEKSVICTANQNGSQADCELGNPFKRDSKVKKKQPFSCTSWKFAAMQQNLRCFFHFYLFNQTTFYIILSTVGMPLDTSEIDIDLLLQT